LESFCPMHINLKDRECLVIGGGSVAGRKVKTLLPYGAKITVLSPEISSFLSEMVAQDKVWYVADHYRPVYLKGKFAVVCASGSEEVNRRAAEDSTGRGILVNNASDPERCTFFLPALAKRGPLTVSVSTSGTSPALARRLRDQINETIKPEYGELLEFLGKIRPLIVRRINNREKRRELFEYLGGEEFYRKFKKTARPELEKFVEGLFEDYGDGRDDNDE